MAAIKTVVIPKEIEPEVVISLWVLKRFGTKNLRGISTAAVVSRKTDSAIFSGEFSLREELKNDNCGLVEMAIAKCGCEKNEKLDNVVRLCSNGNGSILVAAMRRVIDVATLAKSLAWNMQTLDALYDEAFDSAVDENTKPPTSEADKLINQALSVGDVPPDRIITLQRPDGEMVKLAFMTSEGKFEIGKDIDLAFVLDSENYNMCIMSRFSIRDMIRILRVEECLRNRSEELNNVAAMEYMWYELSSEGIHALAPQWCYEKEGDEFEHYHVITTGVKTPRSALRVAEVITLIRHAIDDRFQPQLEHYCKKFKCVATQDFPCPWYHWMLSKCRMVRNAGHKDRETMERERNK